MKGREESATGAARRAAVYCVVPSDLASRLLDTLRNHFRDDPAVEVVVEQREGDRRRCRDRRSPATIDEARAAGDSDRRRIRGALGRRVGERRALAAAVDNLTLPRRARAFADRLAFMERLEPSGMALEDLDTARIVTRIQAGDGDAFALLYLRYFDRVYGYLRVLLGNPAEAEDAAQQVFLSVFEALPRYERRRQPFRAWLFVVVRNRALKHLNRSRRLELLDPADVDDHLESNGAGADPAGAADAGVLDWLSDRELVLFVERLPLVQRQVLLLRYLLDLPAPEVARVLGRSPGYVRKLEERALAFLNARLTALGRAPRCQRRSEHRRMVRQVRVLRARRWALTP